MRFGSVILTAIGIVLACSLPAITGAYLLAHHTPESWWAGAILVIATFLFLVAVTVLFLRRFLFRQFNTLFHLMDKRDISEEELSLLSGKSDIMSNIRKNLMEWNRDKAMEIGQLRQMEKYRKDFLGDVSHELKTPIFNIQGYILTLLDGGLEDKTINRLYLERSEKSINRMIHIVEDLESIARLESGEFHLDYEFFDMSRLVEEVFEMEEMAARETKIRLEMKKKQVIVYADRKRITEVMDNLVGNSIKYGRKNGLTHVSFTEKEHLW